MNIIITAGGTSEKIDKVRKITNTATGKLGCLTALEFYKQSADQIENLFYFAEDGIETPDLPCVRRIKTRGTEELTDELRKVLSNYRIDAIIHSMAVSDYAVRSVTTVERLAEAVAEKICDGDSTLSEKSIRACIEQTFKESSLFITDGKIPSDVENMLIVMRRTNKIIEIFKKMQPQAVLVGFKLLSGVSTEKLIKAGHEIMIKNNCDYVFANDEENLKNGGQSGYLLSREGTNEWIEGKQAIAEQITRSLLKKLGMA